MDQDLGRYRDDRSPSGRDRVGRGGDSRERDYGRRTRPGVDPLDQRVDRWVTAGRQLVEGVSGARPGGRPSARGAERSPLRRPRLDELGRWVEDRLDWLLDDGDDWREPWQEAEAAAAAPSSLRSSRPSRSRRQGLEAVSRRGRASAPLAPVPAAGAVDDGEWPDDASFNVPRWRRTDRSERPDAADSQEPAPAEISASRPLPRSSRRRS
ncbi:MAG: hypothetical protein ER33_10055 [Cyanobium sp. CACIAM 14]|nr:MAG: hypothetical protein ER33_10055 [Cyanobium sp. CACIAM 14]